MYFLARNRMTNVVPKGEEGKSFGSFLLLCGCVNKQLGTGPGALRIKAIELRHVKLARIQCEYAAVLQSSQGPICKSNQMTFLIGLRCNLYSLASYNSDLLSMLDTERWLAFAYYVVNNDTC